MKAAAYVRVSSPAQSHAMQRAAIARAASSRGDTVAIWYAEKQSASKLARPELARLRADVRAGRVRRLYVYRLDRLTRSGIRDTLEVVEELDRGGAELVSIADSFDMRGPARDVVLAVLAWAAQMERDAIGERIRAARARVEANGGTWGRPHRMTKQEREKARDLVMYGGKSIRAVAASMKVPRSTIARAVAELGGKAREAQLRHLRTRRGGEKTPQGATGP